MKHVCTICGYFYDEAKEKVPFKDLPDSWTCPLCGALKSAFVPLEDKKKEEAKKPTRALPIDEDMEKLSRLALSALCSNSARGCEKQYKDEEGFPLLAAKFRLVAAIEKHHEERYRKLLHNVEMKEAFQKSEVKIWECRNSGHLVIGTKAPEICPTSGYAQSFFELNCENY